MEVSLGAVLWCSRLAAPTQRGDWLSAIWPPRPPASLPLLHLVVISKHHSCRTFYSRQWHHGWSTRLLLITVASRNHLLCERQRLLPLKSDPLVVSRRKLLTKFRSPVVRLQNLLPPLNKPNDDCTVWKTGQPQVSIFSGTERPEHIGQLYI